MSAKWLALLLCSGLAHAGGLQISGAGVVKPLAGEVQSAGLIAGAAHFVLEDGEAVVSPWPLAWRKLPAGTRLVLERAPHPAGPVSRLRLLDHDKPWLELIAGGYAGTVVQDSWRLGFKEGQPVLLQGNQSRPFFRKMRMKDQSGANWCLQLLDRHEAKPAAPGTAQETQIKADWLRYLPRKGRC